MEFKMNLTMNFKRNNINHAQNKNSEILKRENEIIKSSKKCFYFYNIYHLGDNVYSMYFFNKLKDYLETNNIHILYYLNEQYINQVSEFIISKNIHIFPINIKKGIDLWIENKNLPFTLSISKSLGLSYNNFYKIFFNSISKKLNIPFNITSFYYEDNELIERYERLPEKYKNIDVLIVNSLPMSGQFEYIEDHWINLIIQFSKKYKTVITKKINHQVNCTLDDNLSIKTIGAMSIKAKVIIAVNTGVVSGLLNIHTLNNVLHYCNLDKFVFFDYPKFTNYDNLKKINITYLMDIVDNYNKIKHQK